MDLNVAVPTILNVKYELTQTARDENWHNIRGKTNYYIFITQ